MKLTWVKGHDKSAGNGKAYEEAWAAAKGSTSTDGDLLAFLLPRPLPKSASALRQQHVHELQALWKCAWALSP